MSGNEFSVLAASRHSVRSFQDTQIATEVLEAILEDARCAPSWSNTRPYKLALASGQQARRLGQAYQAEYDRALPMTHHHLPTILKLALSGKLPDGDYKPLKKYPAELLARSQEIGKGLYTHLGIARHDRQARDAYTRKNFNGFGAPTLGFVFIYRGLLPFSALDAGLMLQTLFLAAKSRGVDSCALVPWRFGAVPWTPNSRLIGTINSLPVLRWATPPRIRLTISAPSAPPWNCCGQNPATRRHPTPIPHPGGKRPSRPRPGRKLAPHGEARRRETG